MILANLFFQFEGSRAAIASCEASNSPKVDSTNREALDVFPQGTIYRSCFTLLPAGSSWSCGAAARCSCSCSRRLHDFLRYLWSSCSCSLRLHDTFICWKPARYSIHAPIKRVFLYFYGSDKHLKTPVRRWTPAFAGETMLPWTVLNTYRRGLR